MAFDEPVAFEGAQGVFNVQNPMKSGLEAEVRQRWQGLDLAAHPANFRVVSSTKVAIPSGITESSNTA